MAGCLFFLSLSTFSYGQIQFKEAKRKWKVREIKKKQHNKRRIENASEKYNVSNLS